ncbi:MAG TPA: SDR family oxidoreductase [Nocardioidaceae bacterium]|nr:SDR family oxidoreductase [Nocardioidaceae bacterium]
MSAPVIVVVGAGPGIGAAVARRFGTQGYVVRLIARSAERLEELGGAIQAEGITTGWSAVDITDENALTQTVARFGEQAGHIDVLHFNPSAFRHKDPLALTPDDLLDDVRLGVASLLTAVQAAVPFMSSGARIVATGSQAADRPWNEAASLGVQKAALRNLVRSIDTTLAPHGVRAMSLTVNGTLAPDTPFAPERVADAIYLAATNAADGWRVEVPYDG